MDNKVSRRNFIAGAAVAATAALAGCSNSSSSSSSSSSTTTTETTTASVKPVILVTSFGTSYNDSRHITIGAIEDAIREKYGHDYDVRRAFTAQIIIDKLKSRDGISIDNVTEALDRCVSDGVKEVIIQPTHLMDGLEYNDIVTEVNENYNSKFDKITIGAPLLTDDSDYEAVADAISEAMADYVSAGYAICLMGHGTEADSNKDYTTMQETFTKKGMTNFFVGTVEATPTCDDVIASAQAAGFTKAALAPFMVVAGDHANNDMADLEDSESWASKFTAAGFEIECVLKGLGQYDTIDDIYVQHVADAITAHNA